MTLAEGEEGGRAWLEPGGGGRDVIPATPPPQSMRGSQ